MFASVFTTRQDVIQSSRARLCYQYLKARPPPTAITVHILHDNTLTQDNRDKFNYIAGRYGQCVKFYNVEKICTDKISEINNLLPDVSKTKFSIAAFYRLFIPQIFSTDIEKVIYLDSDIIVHLDINELWQINLNDKPLGAVPEIFNGNNGVKELALCKDGLVKNEDYFNSGVLLMNVKILRNYEEIIMQGLRFISENPQYGKLVDQDIFNYYFSTRTLKLPVKLNRMVYYSRKNNDMHLGKEIYHFMASSFGMNTDDPFDLLWMKYFVKTPWFNEEALGRLYTVVQQMHIQFNQSMMGLSAIMSGKTRAFFVAPQNVETTKKIFSVRDGEEIILAENQDSLKKLVATMKLSQGKKIFFIMLPNFPFELLTQLGFANNGDFLDGMNFLSEITNSSFLLYSM